MEKYTRFVRVAAAVALALILAVASTAVQPVPVVAAGGGCEPGNDYCHDDMRGSDGHLSCVTSSCDSTQQICCLEEIIVK